MRAEDILAALRALAEEIAVLQEREKWVPVTERLREVE